MEPAAAWTQYDFQLANWTMGQAVWAPGFPVESVSTEIYGSCHETYVPSSAGEQLIEYAVDTQEEPIVKVAQEFQVDFHNMEMKIQHPIPIQVFRGAADRFEIEVNKMKIKIHRYPPCIQALDGWYTMPTMVAIGPYHHYQEHLKLVEQVKHVAAYHCLRESGTSVQQMYDEVVSVSSHARSLYDKEVMACVNDNDFLPMMFYDACFLVQYMLTCTGRYDDMDPSLRSFFDSYDNDIFHDLMLLENQLPWIVVKAVMKFRSVPLENLIDTLKGCLQDHKEGKTSFELDKNYEPPHFLGLLRYYIVGRSKTKLGKLPETRESISFSVSAIELSEMGIELTANKATELVHMGAKKKGPLFGQLFLAPLSLDEARASWLINMAALELCTTPNFQDAEDEESAVCSYLLLFAMIVDRVEDVHELRRTHLLQGGGGLTNKEVLGFLTKLQGLRLGTLYVRTMEEIQDYRSKRWPWTMLYGFFYRNSNTIKVIFTIIGSIVGILGTIAGIYFKFR